MTRFQREEKAKKIMNEAMRIEGIRSHQNFYQQKVLQSEMMKDLREQNKLRTKYDAVAAYEQVSFMLL